MKNKTLIRIEQLSFGFGDNAVLSDISLNFPTIGLVGIMGPSGVGKSSLLRSIAGITRFTPNFWLTGKIFFQDKTIQDRLPSEIQPAISYFSQKSRLYTGSVLENLIPGNSQLDVATRKTMAKKMLEDLGLWHDFYDKLDARVMSLSMGAHKKILFARMFADKPQCILIDEPYSWVALSEEPCINVILRKMAESCLVLLVTHNKVLASAICDDIVLLSAGELMEVSKADVFFSDPKTRAGRSFLESGSSWNLSETKKTNVDDTPVAVVKKTTSVIMPRGFYWIKKEYLGGMMKPGLLDDVERDHKALSQLNVTNLINLIEQPIGLEHAAEFGLNGVHFPIDDMGCPDLEATNKICAWVSNEIKQDHSCIFHCRAGLGRTGLMLACVLVYQGASAVQAIHEIRTINNSYIQSDEQFNFISEFEMYKNKKSSNDFKRGI